MRLLLEGRERWRRLWGGRPGKIDRQFFLAFLPKKFPSLQQLAYLGLFLRPWEKRLVAIGSVVALVSLVGLIWQIRWWHTVDAPASGGTLQEVVVGQPRFVNPILAISDSDRAASRLLFLPLCNFSEFAQPTLANCEINAAGTEVKISLLPDRRWHDGQPVVADDVIYTLAAAEDPTIGSPWLPLSKRVFIKKIDAQTLTATAKRTPQLPQLMSIGILPAHLWKNIAPANFKTAALNLKPVGNGPFLLDHLITDGNSVRTMVLRAFDDFAPSRAWLDFYYLRFAADTEEATEMFRTRQVDAFLSFDPAAATELIKRDVERYIVTPPVVVSLFFNPLKNAALRNLEVRQAVAMAINRVELSKQAFAGEATPTRAPFPRALLDPPAGLEPDFDNNGARTLFTRNKIGTTTTTWQLGTLGTPAYAAAAHQIAEQLGIFGIQVGVNILPEPLMPGELLNYDLLVLGQDYGAAGNIFPFWHSMQAGLGGANYAHYRVAGTDDLLAALQVETDGARRVKLLRDINALLAKDLPAVFLLQPTYQFFVTRAVQGITVENWHETTDRLANVADWYLRTAKAPAP